MYVLADCVYSCVLELVGLELCVCRVGFLVSFWEIV